MIGFQYFVALRFATRQADIRIFFRPCDVGLRDLRMEQQERKQEGKEEVTHSARKPMISCLRALELVLTCGVGEAAGAEGRDQLTSKTKSQVPELPTSKIR